MIQQTLAVIRNTFFESIRQPIAFVLLVAATLLILLANPISAFTMSDDQRMLIDIGLATVFLFGMLLAAFIATSVLTQEIDNRTALTVISKPVGRPVFMLGKYVGVAAAITLAMAYMGLVFALVERHGVMQTVRDPYHMPAIFFGVGAGLIGVGAGIWCNYFYNMVFVSTTVVIATPLMALAYVLSLFFTYDFAAQPPGEAFDGQLWLAMMCLWMAVLVLTAIAIAASTRLSQIMTLAVTVGLFLLGMLSDWIFGRRIAALRDTWFQRARDEGLARTETVTETITKSTGETFPLDRTVQTAEVPLAQFAEGGELIFYWLLNAAYAIVPNFQVMLLTDALTQEHVIPGMYVLRAALYALLLIIAALGLATILFQRREVG